MVFGRRQLFKQAGRFEIQTTDRPAGQRRQTRLPHHHRVAEHLPQRRKTIRRPRQRPPPGTVGQIRPSRFDRKGRIGIQRDKRVTAVAFAALDAFQ